MPKTTKKPEPKKPTSKKPFANLGSTAQAIKDKEKRNQAALRELDNY